MTKIMLVHPEISRGKYNFAGVIENEPLELEYISQMLKDNGFEVIIWDGQAEKIPLKAALENYLPDYFYVCGRTRQENFMKEYARLAKEICGSATIIGGVYVQKCYERFYEPYIDFILTSFDIFKILDILKHISPRKIEGICYRDKKGNFLCNPPKPFEITKLPLPDREYFYSHPNNYRYLELSPCAHVRTAYCCPFRCAFCYRNSLNCGVYSRRRVTDVVDEIAQINCENIYFIDDDFLWDREYISEFIRLVRQRGICKKYVCYGRADFIAENPDIIRSLGEIGFYYILTGLEAADERRLARYRKKTTTDVNIKAVEVTRSAGINIMGMFIADLDFSPADFSRLYRFIKKNRIRHTAISIFTPEIGSGLYKKFKNRLVTENPECWDYLHVVAKPYKMGIHAFYFFYHILVARLFFKGMREGVYDFIDYRFYLESIFKNMFTFGGNAENHEETECGKGLK